MKTNKIIIISIVIVLLKTVFVANLSAQEFLIPLYTNPVLKANSKIPSKYKSGVKHKNTKVELPFFDDFSTDSLYPYPSTKLWEDSFVFINIEKAIKPPSLGVATFDALNQYGEVHDVSGKTKNIPADMLTSRPILLDENMKNVFLSFAYQPQGLCDVPEEKDSLILQFYSPEDSLWYSQLSIKGTPTHDFRFIIIPVSHKRFLKDGFRFRFINYVSLSSGAKPSYKGNADYWHIDYIFLNQGRHSGDTIFKDLAICTPLKSLLKDYESMPWKHYRKINEPYSLMRDSFKVEIRNLSDRFLDVEDLNIYSRNVQTDHTKSLLRGSDRNFPPNSVFTWSVANESYIFPNPQTDSDYAEFEIYCKYKPKSSDDTLANNIGKRRHDFYNYYAYDDGSSEVGYGLSGEGSSSGYIAVKQHTLVEDSLKAIKIYFNQTYQNASKKSFYLKIWESADTIPGEEIFSKYIEAGDWDYSPNINDFINFTFKDGPKLSGDFWIGLQTIGEDLLNIGYDLNIDNSENLRYNVNDKWERTKHKGTIMIRPVFGELRKEDYGTSIAGNELRIEPIVYPNPVKDVLIVDLGAGNYGQNKVMVYDIHGKLIDIQESTNPKMVVDMTRFAGSFFIIRVFHNNLTVKTEKIIKVKY